MSFEAAEAHKTFSVDFEVRDSELDAQGIVNNANYLHYYEHARHLYLRSRGVDFVGMHEAGLDAVVFRIEVDYRESLRSFDGFSVSVAVEREGSLRMIFRQEIVKKSNGHLASSARVVAAIVSGGRPVRPPADMMERLLA
jgi:acyl-CoA thioester hydrolase